MSLRNGFRPGAWVRATHRPAAPGLRRAPATPGSGPQAENHSPTSRRGRPRPRAARGGLGAHLGPGPGSLRAAHRRGLREQNPGGPRAPRARRGARRHAASALRPRSPASAWAPRAGPEEVPQPALPRRLRRARPPRSLPPEDRRPALAPELLAEGRPAAEAGGA
ncbi:putative uncharacterized protein MGC34800 [Choloepus didactylus]|uniref:putative uncharacterized protein MGC34800 n=1 Tax=Choloepus didactylus TaxID=27675 RepID=UPI00189F0613|nr:putative uncharacterized protein MGC34800 [Choloepus didactylus]